MIIPLPENVQIIINELYDHGYAAYAVGGCVRDVLLGRIPGDWDITTSAKPSEIKAVFRRTVDTGIAHGTVTVLLGNDAYEVTTFRIDGEYLDARHPEQVIFVPDLKEDLLRRDFTINAMAYNDREGLIDLYDGITDLKKGIIRCVGDPVARFTEDALRMMRAVRFSAQLGFDIDEGTVGAISLLKNNISRVSAERIQAELVKLVLSEYPEKWEIARETGLATLVLPELEAKLFADNNNSCSGKITGKPHGSFGKSGSITDEPEIFSGTADHIYRTLRSLPHDRGTRLSAMFYDLSRDEAAHIMKRLKFDNATYYLVTALIGLKDEILPTDEAGVRLLLNRVGDEVFNKSLDIREAQISGAVSKQASSSDSLSEVFGVQKGGNISEQICKAREIYDLIRQRGDCTDMKALAVNGGDLKAMGIETGPVIGEILNRLLQEVLKDPQKNNREYLLEQVFSNKKP